MTQPATVEQLLEGNRARVAVVRQSACGHACETCAGCGAAKQVVHATAYNRIGAAPGDRVLVCSDGGKVLGAAALVYLLPILTFFLSYGLSAGMEHPVLRALAVLAGTALGLAPAMWLDRHSRLRFEITERL